MKKIFLLFIYFSMFYVISNDAIAQSPFEEFTQKLDEQSAYQDTQIQESNARLYKLQQELSERRQVLVKKKEEIIKKQLEYEKQFRKRMQEIYPYIAMIPVGVDYHYIEKSYDDEEFVIDGDEYKAFGYCFDIKKGDPVIFVVDEPGSLCITAQILNLRTMRGCSIFCR